MLDLLLNIVSTYNIFEDSKHALKNNDGRPLQAGRRGSLQRVFSHSRKNATLVVYDILSLVDEMIPRTLDGL